MNQPNTSPSAQAVPAAQASPTLDDLIAKMLEWKKPPASRSSKAPKAPSIGAKPAPPPEPIAPGAWRHSSRWTSEALVIVVQTVVCDNCASCDTSSQPFVYVERYHPVFGRHLEALSPHSPKHGELPRALREVESRVMYCRHCFLTSDCASSQIRLPFDVEQPGVFETNGILHITDLFNVNSSPAPDGHIDSAGTNDRGPVPSELPFYAPVRIEE